ncbi:hypothetical protein O4H49_16280 [Kiloniella laminariae]|uniref:asparagine synthase (glutamine-hydrolyzing) n=1 Tax=Kiloniella laminariae TaxID=454162 RepID=A0ABT4LN83_9PROT|nr:hypothetical protein [Kiloniella laminariae]MCZ4282345.1 hypothetical protein [Kiloniella laminariae]
MEFKLNIGQIAQGCAISSNTLTSLYSSPYFSAEGNGATSISTLAGDKLFCFGNILGWRDKTHKLHPYPTTMSALQDISGKTEINIQEHLEGRFLLVWVQANGKTNIYRDQFGKIDVYLQRSNEIVTAASDLSLLPENPARDGYDQCALAHTLTYYGHRPPKKHTIYKSVTRLGVGETISINHNNFKIHHRPMYAKKQQEDFGIHEEKNYVDSFLDHLEASSSSDGNAIFLSSGWDSTSILAGLVHLRGPQKVRGVIGQMKYSERSGICNRYEIERAKKFSEHYGVKIDIVDLDHLNNAPQTISDAKPIFKKHNFQSITGLNHYLLAQKIKDTACGEETSYIGEISDGAHNLGFSQYATIFHPSYDFREYADKMASYLFGPTFIKQIKNKSYNQDPIFQLFKSKAGATNFDDPDSTYGGQMRQMLTSFFLRNGRMPFWSITNSKLLKPSGAEKYTRNMQECYFQGIENSVEEEIYSWYLDLYNSFHWQGSTVLTAHIMSDHFGAKSDMPYWDGQIQNLLKVMPESYGRGLDFKSTKYLLKSMLGTRIPYPKDLQTGPHSYTYDTDHNFNHNFELLYHSSMRNLAIDTLKAKPYEEILHPDTFNLGYASELVDRYIVGEKLEGSELSDIVSLYLICQTGWYS